jgi:hypothetical protein
MIREHTKMPLPKIYEYRVLTINYTDLPKDAMEMQEQGWVILEETFLIMDSLVKFVVKKQK